MSKDSIKGVTSSNPKLTEVYIRLSGQSLRVLHFAKLAMRKSLGPKEKRCRGVFQSGAAAPKSKPGHRGRKSLRKREILSSRGILANHGLQWYRSTYITTSLVALWVFSPTRVDPICGDGAHGC